MSKHDTCEACGGRVPASALKCPHCGSTELRERPEAAAGPRPGEPGGNRLGFYVVMGLFVIGGSLAAGGAVVALAVGMVTGRPSAPSTPADGPATVVTRGSGGFAAVKTRGKLRAAVDPDAAPFLSHAASGGYEGYEYAVLAAIAGQRGVDFELVERDFAGLLPAVTNGEADLAIGQLAPVGATGVDWSVSYLQYELCLIVPVASSVTTLADLRGGTIGVYDDPAAITVIGEDLGTDWTRKVYSDYGYFDDLVAGRIHAMVYDCPLAKYELRGYAGKLKIADDALAVRTYAVAVPQSDPELKRDVDAVLRDLGGAGLLQKLAVQWLDAPTRDAYETRGKRRAALRSGETLAAFAERTLGDAGRAPDVHAANRDVIGSDPEAVYGGMLLRIP